MKNYKEEFDALEALPVEDLFKIVERDALVFEAGIMEAVKRYIKFKTNTYIDRDVLVVLLGMEKEKEDE